MKLKSVNKRRQMAKKYRNMMRVNRTRKIAAIILMALNRDGRIPKTLQEFNSYINDAVGYLNNIRGTEPQKRGLMLGMTVGQLNDLATVWFPQWFTGNPASPGLWELHGNVYGDTQTKTVDDNVVKFMKDFRAFFQPILNVIATSGVIDNEDKNILKIALGDDTKTDKPVITKKLKTSLSTPGDGLVKVVTEVMADDDTIEEGRPHVDADADGVEVRYKIGGTAPASWKDCPLTKVQSSATMKIDVGAENAGQRLYVYAHSVNFSDASKNGPFAGMVSTIIQG